MLHMLHKDVEVCDVLYFFIDRAQSKSAGELRQ